MADYVPPSLWQPETTPSPTSTPAENNTVPTVDTNLLILLIAPSDLTGEERWEKFQDQFGIQHPEQSVFKSSIQTAKYDLDEAAFAVNELTRSVEDALRFEYDVRELTRLQLENRPKTRIYGDPWTDFLENARLKSDVHLDAFRRDAYFGVKFLFPVGD